MGGEKSLEKSPLSRQGKEKIKLRETFLPRNRELSGETTFFFLLEMSPAFLGIEDLKLKTSVERKKGGRRRAVV